MAGPVIDAAILTAVFLQLAQVINPTTAFRAICESIMVQIAQLLADTLIRMPYTRKTSRIVDRCLVAIDRAEQGGQR